MDWDEIAQTAIRQIGVAQYAKLLEENVMGIDGGLLGWMKHQRL